MDQLGFHAEAVEGIAIAGQYRVKRVLVLVVSRVASVHHLNGCAADAGLLIRSPMPEVR